MNLKKVVTFVLSSNTDRSVPFAMLLAIESSCDETSAAVLQGPRVRSNVISSQLEHRDYGGVIPELASRLHQQQIIRVIDKALREAKVERTQLSAVAFTRGPGLMGALLVGTSFAKALAYGLGIPLVEVNHMQAHVLANFLLPDPPQFPFICLTVSGGHTQLVLVRDYLDMTLLGETIDDAAGEAFDKGAKLLGLPYPGGPHVDRLAATGNPEAFAFPSPAVGRLSFSFSGLKTALLYLLQDGLRAQPDFIEQYLADLCASYQHRIVSILLHKLRLAVEDHPVKDLAIAGGVSANRELRQRFVALGEQLGLRTHLPPFEYCTDNAAMIGIAAHYKLQAGLTTDLRAVPFTRGGF
jgi:N6-L-threonylcarbamoyladenine synthase